MRCQFCNRENRTDAQFCGKCGKVLLYGIGRTDSSCPYCLVELKKRPLAKTKCKNCGENIYSRTRPIDETKVLLTEAEAEIVEIQWATAKGTLDYYREEKKKKKLIEEQLKAKLGREPLKSEIQTEHLKRENPVRRKRTRQLYRQHSDVIEGWEWLAPKQTRSCVYCIAMDGKRFPHNVPFQSLNRCENEYCRCTIIAVIQGIERPQRSIGRNWFATLSDVDKRTMLGETRFQEYRRGRSLDELLNLI
ncbi:MAG: hypothetical protein AB7F88_03515 [Pyrinomonadaceae bacterium]